MRWQEVNVIFLEELRRGTQRGWFRFMTLLIPVSLLVAVVVTPIVQSLTNGDNEQAKPASAGLVDSSGLIRAEDARQAGLQVFQDRQAGVASLLDGRTETVLVIPQDYLSTGRVEWLYRKPGISAALSDEGLIGRIQSLLRAALLRNHVGDDVATRFISPASYTSVDVGEGGGMQEATGGSSKLTVAYIFGIMLMMTMFMGSGFLLESVSDEKQNRMIEVLLTSASPLGIMTGKVLAMGAMGLGQMVLWAASVTFLGPRAVSSFPQLGQVDVEPAILVWIALFFLAGYFFLAVVMAAIGAASTSYRESSQISVFVMMPAAIPLWFFDFIAGNPDGTLARTLSFIPVTAPMAMVERITVTQVPILEILLSLGVTLGAGLALLWVSARIFRAGLLLYGQRMTLRRMALALRQAG